MVCAPAVVGSGMSNADLPEPDGATNVSRTPTLALVLAGGGLAGIAWELGVLRGLADVDAALAERVMGSDVVVGTSAGSVVGAQVTAASGADAGATLDHLYAAQRVEATTELSADLDLTSFGQRLATATASARSAAEVRRAVGAFALAADTVAPQERLAVIRTRLPRPEWPARDLRIVTVDARSGDRRVIDGGSGVDLALAVAASCAVPGIWPVVTIGDRQYVDGGVHSGANADVAAGCDVVLVLSPTLPDGPTVLGRPLADELIDLGSAAVHVIHADAASLAAFGANPLSPSTRRPSAAAGREVGRAHAARVAALLEPSRA